MNTKKMIADILSACSELENEKSSLLERVKQIEDRVTAYHMAVESLELTMAGHAEPAKPEPKEEKKQRYGRKTILEFGNRKQTVTKWAKEMNLTPDAIVYRLTAGWSVQDALTKPKNQGKPIALRHPRKLFAYDSHNNVIRQYTGIGDASRDLKMPENVIRTIIENISRDDQLANRNFYLAWAG